MDLTVVHNTDMSVGLAYRIARIVYAETGAQSLPVVEALTSMIQNYSNKSGIKISDFISDENMFPVLLKKSPHHERLYVCPNERGFQMCLRVAQRMLHGGLSDCCHGATCFHHANVMPDWARARGYIADIDGMLFYL